MIVYMNVEHLDIYIVFNKNERLNVNVWAANKALILISQRLGNFRLNGRLIRLCWRENKPCLLGALRKEKEKKRETERNKWEECPGLLTHEDTTQVQFGSSVSLPWTTPYLFIQSHSAVLESGDLHLHFGGWEEVIRSVKCVFLENAHSLCEEEASELLLPCDILPPVHN